MADRTLRARLVAETSGFSARMAAAEAQIARLDRAPVVAARGMGQLQTGMRLLAFQATGLTGPIGAAANALGSFALGAPLMLAVTAGLGAGALAARLFGNEIEEFGRKSHAVALDRAISSIHESVRKLSETPLDRLRLDLQRTERGMVELKRTATQTATEVLRIPVPGVPGAFATATRTRTFVSAEDEQQAKVLTADRLTLIKAISEEQVKQRLLTQDTLIAMQEIARLEAARLQSPRLQLLNQLGGGALRGQAAAVANIDRPERALALRRIANESLGVELNRVSLDLKRKEHASLILITAAMDRFADAADLSAARTQDAAARAILGIGALVQGALAGGGPGGFLGGALGIAGAFVTNPVLGAALTVGGGILSTLTARQNRDPIPVRDDRLHDLMERERQRPVHVHVTVLDAFGRPTRQLQEEIAQSERFDAVPRFGAGNIVVAGA